MPSDVFTNAETKRVSKSKRINAPELVKRRHSEKVRLESNGGRSFMPAVALTWAKYSRSGFCLARRFVI